MEAKFFVYAGLRWRKLDVGSGRVSGWAERARFLVSRGGRLRRVRRTRVLRGLRALAAGHPRSVRDAAPLLQIKPYSPKQEQHTNGRHCSCDTHKNALQNANKTALCNAATQTVVMQDAAVDTMVDNQPPPVTNNTTKHESKPGPLKHKTFNTDKPPHKKKKEPINKASVKHKEASEADIDTQSCKELIINEDDVDALRNFLDKNNLFDVDLDSFDADDNYKSMVFYKINPLVSVERCPRIARMYKRRSSNDISLADFATKLGLTAVTDLAVKKRYKMRKRGLLVGMSTESDKENHSDSSVMVVSDSSVEKNKQPKRPQMYEHASKKNNSYKGSFQRIRQSNKKKVMYKSALQRNGQSNNKSKIEQSSTSEWSESNDKSSESSNSESECSNSDSAFESPSDRKDRLRRTRKGSDSHLQSTRQVRALHTPNITSNKNDHNSMIKESNLRTIDDNKGNLLLDRDGMKSRPIQKNKVLESRSTQKANEPQLRPPKRKSEVDLLLDKIESSSRKKNANQKVNESPLPINEKIGSEITDKVLDTQPAQKPNPRKNEVELLLDRSVSVSRRRKNNELNAQANQKTNAPISQSDQDASESQTNRKDITLDAQKNETIESRLRPNRNKNGEKLQLQQQSETELNSQKNNESDIRSNLKINESDPRLNRRRSELDMLQSGNNYKSVNRKKNNSATRREDKKTDIKHEVHKLDVKYKTNKSDTVSMKEKSNSQQKENKAATKRKENDNKTDMRQKQNKSDKRQKETKPDESETQSSRKGRDLSSSNKKVVQTAGATEGLPEKLKPLQLAIKRPLRPPTNDSTISSYREYSSLEDHAIVAWVSRGGRARLVNGNRVWRELQQEYADLVGIERSWHSLRNRYLRYILPRLGDLAISPPRATELRAAAARGEIKSFRRPAPAVRSPPRVLSAWGARPRPKLTSSSEEEEPPADKKTKPTASAERAEHAEHGSRSPRRRPPPTPSYSELTRRFAPKLRSTPNESPSPGRSPRPAPAGRSTRRLYNPKTAL